MRGYKVVRRTDLGELVSARIGIPARVIYKPGKWVKAPRWLAKKSYHLTFFIRLKDAQRFLPNKKTKWMEKYEIWECDWKGLLKEVPPLCVTHKLERGIFIRVGSYWPSGTLMAKEIKLIKRVWPEG